MNNLTKNIALWLVIGLVLVMVFQSFSQTERPGNQVSFSEFMHQVEQGNVTQVTIQGEQINGSLLDGQRFSTYAPADSDVVKTLREKEVSITAKPEEGTSMLVSILISWFPMLLLIAVWIFFMRQMQGGGAGGKGAMSFGKSKAKMLTDESNKVRFEDVAGIDEAKEEVEELVDFLKEPEKFQKLGGHIPKGVLFTGPPGSGKTLLGKAVAGEAGVPFFSISGSDFVEMFVGVGASRVRDMFEQAKKQAPCIIFIDEIDAVGRQRGAGLGGGHDEREQTLNQLLTEMDGFEGSEGVIVVAATNRPDVLDPALLRPGRFDRQVVVPRPDVRGREFILQVHMKKVPFADDVDAHTIARGTPGFSGADLENLVNEAALMAARRGARLVEMQDFETAKDKVMMGLERKSIVLSEEQRRTTAYHESGHALVAKLLPGTDPVHKVTIIPRGQAMGLTMQLPDEDRYNYERQELLNNIAILMGGRIAEQVFLDQMTTGAGNDIERATEMARKMVTEWGMSEKLGPLTYGEKDEEVFLGREVTQHKNISETTVQEIDAEVRSIIETEYKRARQLIEGNRETLGKMAEALLEWETLDAQQINDIMEGRDPRPPQGPEGGGPSPEPEPAGDGGRPVEPTGGQPAEQP
ncbi:cell division protein FtsH [Thiohalorhabdus denitrificans]|uniref:ATP-dependent zinc metalloprotease FtsH n=1 Tax=Thiohalorhabdus denitrificans TaxID=381306 RepID=A0A0P9CF92_9GAMM|nr:ATP-dependent zinc metalloprotease FtsH [Thiohalorhabdus denitrificans]KPV41646.1 cell division protein FtsH [Thiohalorhabdus denitrificans]SCY56561.1 membrane protease FtsH catalytic subunit [Thiohalorhabdus denitrificans]